MITAGRLRELLTPLPSGAKLIAYGCEDEGEGIGLRIAHGERSGWIETGSDDDLAVSDSEHDLTEFQSRGKMEYQCVNYPFVINRENEDKLTTDWLNQQASEGWRLTAVVSFIYYFEREKKS